EVDHGRSDSENLPPLGAAALRATDAFAARETARTRPGLLPPGHRAPPRFVTLLRLLRNRDARRPALRSGRDGLFVALRLLRRRLLQPQDRPGLRTQPGLPGHRWRRPPRLPHHQ